MFYRFTPNIDTSQLIACLSSGDAGDGLTGAVPRLAMAPILKPHLIIPHCSVKLAGAEVSYVKTKHN